MSSESTGTVQAAVPHTLNVSGLVKRFGPVHANDGIDVEFTAGEIHALLGENGAGKSTLIKILAGIYRPDEGTIEVSGRPVRIDSPSRARELGIAVVHQQSMLVPRLTVAENVTLQEGGLGRIDRSLAERLVESGKRLNFDLDLDAPVERLTLGERQRVEIARALMVDARFVILDEPTAVLAPAERADFFQLLTRLAAKGVGVVFVTHHLAEAIEHSRRITVLRLGQVVGRTDDTTELSESDLVRMMVGEVEFRGKVAAGPVGADVLTLRGVSGAPPGGRRLEGVDVAVRSGEVLGVAGVEGNGQRELAAVLTGAWTPTEGSVELRGKPLNDYTPTERVQLVGDVPDDHALGTCDELSVWENIALSTMTWLEPRTPRNVRRFRESAKRLVREFDIRTPNVNTPVGRLSGGNRRRVVLARELSKKPAVAVLTFATKGLDVRSAEQVKQWTRQLAKDGAGVVYISSDLEELFDVSDRVAVLARGRVTGVLTAEEATTQRIGMLMLVGAEDESEASGS